MKKAISLKHYQEMAFLLLEFHPATHGHQAEIHIDQAVDTG
jgi:hypothetical protein